MALTDPIEIRKDWVRRCADRLRRNGGVPSFLVEQSAQACADRQAQLHGSSGVAWGDPEDAADAHAELLREPGGRDG